jgi:hypothetical protein
MDKFTDSLLYVLPALVVAGGIFLLVRRFLDNEYRLRLLESRRTMLKDMLPLRLQAYERICLLLERISPGSLLNRVYSPGMNVRAFQSELLSQIRAEFEHNMVQQIYLSPAAWELVRNAKEDIIRIINLAAAQAGEEASGSDLSRAVYDIMIKTESMPAQKALDFVKQEVRQLFMQ